MSRISAVSDDQFFWVCYISAWSVFELYPVFVFTAMVHYMAEIFFPSADPMLSLVGSLFAFFASFLGRVLMMLLPAKKQSAGARIAFLSVPFMSALASVAIGFMPTHEEIGTVAPLLLVLLRASQGGALGNGLPCAMICFSENVPQRTGLLIGILSSSIVICIALCAFLQGVLSFFLGFDEMYAWGWRIPFWLGGPVGIVCCLFRKRLYDFGVVKSFESVSSTARLDGSPLNCRNSTFWSAALLMTFCGSTVMLLGVFVPGFLSCVLGFHIDRVAVQTAVALLVFVPLLLVMSTLSDVHHHRRATSAALVLLMICLVPVFDYLTEELLRVRRMLMFSGFIIAVTAGLLPAAAVRLFVGSSRFDRFFTIYTTGFLLVGGFTPMVATLLTRWTGSVVNVGYCLLVLAAVTLLVLRWNGLKTDVSGVV